MPRFEVSDEHAAGDRFRFEGAAAPVAGAEHGRPHAREHFAQEDLFQDAADERPLPATGLLAGRGQIDAEGLQTAGPAVQAAFRFAPVLLQAAAGERCEPRISTGPWAVMMAANSTSSRACMNPSRLLGMPRFRAPCEAWSDENGTVPFWKHVSRLQFDGRESLRGPRLSRTAGHARHCWKQTGCRRRPPPWAGAEIGTQSLAT